MLTKAQKKRKEKIKNRLMLCLKISAVLAAAVLGIIFARDNLKREELPDYDEFVINAADRDYMHSEAEKNSMKSDFIDNSDALSDAAKEKSKDKSDKVISQEEKSRKTSEYSDEKKLSGDRKASENDELNGDMKSHYSDDGKLNINLASVEELCTLKGIGIKKAEAIIRYRELNGGFGSILEIMNISGIKNGVFDKVKDYITAE